MYQLYLFVFILTFHEFSFVFFVFLIYPSLLLHMHVLLDKQDAHDSSSHALRQAVLPNIYPYNNLFINSRRAGDAFQHQKALLLWINREHFCSVAV